MRILGLGFSEAKPQEMETAVILPAILPFLGILPPWQAPPALFLSPPTGAAQIHIPKNQRKSPRPHAPPNT
jgi:hypothetical protein